MSATSVRLLQAAADIAGGNEALAMRLGISTALVSAYMADRRPLPDALLLRAVDIILADRQPGRAQASDAGAPRVRLDP
jgi:hypothetical protein